MEIENKDFVDGAFGHNNPAFLACQEVEQKHLQDTLDPSSLHETECHDKNIISIGTGRAKRTKLVGPPGLRRYRNFFWHTTQVATDTANIEQIMDVQSAREGVFYKRLNVDQGLGHIDLDECKTKKHPTQSDGITFVTLDHIEAMTRAYLNKEATHSHVVEAARKIYDAVQARQDPSYPNCFPFRGPNHSPPTQLQNGEPR